MQAWDLASGRRYGLPLTGHDGQIWGLAGTLLPDGTPIAVSVDRAAVRAWNLATGRAHGPAVPNISISPEIACGRLPDGTPVVVIAFEDVQVRSLLVTPSAQGLTGSIRTLGCVRLPDGDEVVVTVGYEDQYTIQLWDADTGRLRDRLLPGNGGDAVACVRLRDGGAVVLTQDDTHVRLWDLTSGDSSDGVLAEHTGEVDVLDCFTLDDGTPILLTDAPVRAWELDTGRPYGPPLPVDLSPRRAVSSMRLPDGTLIALIFDDDDQLCAWDLRTGRPHGPRVDWPTNGMDAEFVAATLLADGTPVAVTIDGNENLFEPVTLRVWDLATGGSRG